MAESVGLGINPPDTAKTLNTINSFLDIYKKAQTVGPETEAAISESKAKTVKGRAEIAQRKNDIFNALATNEDVIALQQDPTNTVLQNRVQKAIAQQADQAVDYMGEEYKPQIYGYAGKLMNYAQQNGQNFAQLLKTRTTGGVGGAIQQELQAPRVQVNAAGQLVRTNPITNQVEVLGDARALLGKGGVSLSPVMPANPTQAQGQVLGQTGKTGAEDWATTFNEAQAVPVRLQALEKIRDLSKKTTTGTGADQVRLLNGVLDLLGIDRQSAANLDELKKNSAILQMGPAGTDLARSIQSMATPGAQIQPEAIRKISDQLIGLERRKSAKAKYLEPFKNDINNYTQKALEFSNVADPIFFQDISDEEYNKYKKELSEDRKNQLKEKARKMRELGIE